jgi:hypothetical protein
MRNDTINLLWLEQLREFLGSLERDEVPANVRHEQLRTWRHEQLRDWRLGIDRKIDAQH